MRRRGRGDRGGPGVVSPLMRSMMVCGLILTDGNGAVRGAIVELARREAELFGDQVSVVSMSLESRTMWSSRGTETCSSRSWSAPSGSSSRGFSVGRGRSRGVGRASGPGPTCAHLVLESARSERLPAAAGRRGDRAAEHGVVIAPSVEVSSWWKTATCSRGAVTILLGAPQARRSTSSRSTAPTTESVEAIKDERFDSVVNVARSQRPGCRGRG